MDFLKISFPALPSPRLSQQISTSACTLRLRVPPTASSLQQIQPEEERERENCANPPTWTTTNSLEISHAKAKSSTSPVQLAVLSSHSGGGGGGGGFVINFFFFFFSSPVTAHLHHLSSQFPPNSIDSTRLSGASAFLPLLLLLLFLPYLYLSSFANIKRRRRRTTSQLTRPDQLRWADRAKKWKA